ncbi:MAG: DUF1840 family protein [Betaproteobacteria bacterium]|nr:DUF1840 family protein [Betaproteobacteria bacterium]
MIVKMTSSAAGQLILFAETAHRLLHIAGKECTARGVITAAEIPSVLEKLRAAVAEEKAAATRRGPGADDEERKREEEANASPGSDTMSLARRAPPFIQLLERSLREEESYIVWEAAQDF